MLGTNAVTGEQRFLWVCRNVRKKRCDFPIGLPYNVFHVTRNAAEKRGHIPKPNIRLLPAKFRRLYPSVFVNNRTINSTSRCGTAMSMGTADLCSSYSSTLSPCSSRSSDSSYNTATDHLLQQGEENLEERELLSCCYCGAALEPVILHTDAVTGKQRLLWVCINTKRKLCVFPMGLPYKVFNVTRTIEEKKSGYIPKPNVLSLPAKFRGFYPSLFANRTNASSRCGTSVSIRTTDLCSSYPPTQSPSTSRSSVSSDNTAIGQPSQRGQEDGLFHLDSESSVCHGLTLNGKNTNLQKPSVPSVDDFFDERSLSTEMNSECAYSSTETTESDDGIFSDFICDQLRNINVDVSQLKDEELIKKMADVVKQLENDRRRNNLRRTSSSTYRVPFECIYDLDVTPIKRKLNVLSTDLPRAVAVMRSGCNVETMIDAMGGNSAKAAPPMTRTRTSDVERELKKRVNALLMKLPNSSCEIQSEVNTAADAISADIESSRAQEWYEGEDGPSTSADLAPDHNALASSAEEERLNAIVQNSIRSQIANSFARRSAYQRERMQGLTQQGLQSTYTQASLPLHVDEAISTESYSDELLSFDFPQFDNADLSQENVDNHSQSHGCEKQLVPRESQFEYGLHSDLQSIEDNEFGLFDDIIY